MPDPAEWTPARVVVVPATLVAGAVTTGKTLPAGLTAPAPEAAAAEIRAALMASLATCATRFAVEPAGEFTRTGTAGAVAKLCRQYQDARQADPAAGRDAAAEFGGETPESAAGVLLITVLKYGPEVDEDVSSMSKSVSTTVGTTDVGISSSTQRIVAYLNVHFRCALVRGHDGVLVWDASARRRVKSAAAGEAGLPGLLAQAAADLCRAWPWRPRPVEGEADPEESTAPSGQPASAAPAAAGTTPAVVPVTAPEAAPSGAAADPPPARPAPASSTPAAPGP